MSNLEKFTFIIPARMESTRFPNKPLKILNNRPVIDWVYQNCTKSKFCENAIVATDSEKIKNYCEETGKKYVLTGEHNCASNRVAEASSEIARNWIVEVQGDEPLLWAKIMCFMLVHRRSVDKQKTHKHKIAPAAGGKFSGYIPCIQWGNKQF